jgi:hypothetical protein
MGENVSMGTFSASGCGPKRSATELDKPLPLRIRICLRADLYPRVYMPDLTTSARRAVIDSVDFAALDLFMDIGVKLGGGIDRASE